MPSRETLDKLKAWSERVGVPLQELVERFNKELGELRRLYPDMSPAKLERKARAVVYNELRSELRSPAVWYQGIIVAVGPARDLNARLVAEIDAMGERAELDGWKKIGPDGKVHYYDMREKLPNGKPNPFYGREITPFVVRTAILVGGQEIDDRPGIVYLDLTGDYVENPPPMWVPLRFRAIPRNGGRAKTTRVTRFVEHDFGFGVGDALEMLKPDLYKPVKEIDGSERTVMVYGEVVEMGHTRDGRIILRVTDESLDILDEPLFAIVPPDLSPYIDFDIGSEVILIGRPWIGDRGPAMEVWGVYSPREARVPK